MEPTAEPTITPENPSDNSENVRHFADDDFGDYFAQANVLLPALQALSEFQAFYSDFYGVPVNMTICDKKSFLKSFIELKKQKQTTHEVLRSPSSTNATSLRNSPDGSKSKPNPAKTPRSTPSKHASSSEDNAILTEDGLLEWNEGDTRVKGSPLQYLDSKENSSKSTPASEPKTRTTRSRARTTASAVPSFDEIKQQIRSFDHNSTRGKHRSAFYTEQDVIYMRTQRGSRSDTELMRRVGAGFDWPLKLWWVPNDSQLSAEYEKFVLDAEENAAFNALHDQVMHMLDEDED